MGNSKEQSAKRMVRVSAELRVLRTEQWGKGREQRENSEQKAVCNLTGNSKRLAKASMEKSDHR